MAIVVIAESLLMWLYVIYVRSVVARKMGISHLYALTTSLGAAIFSAMMISSAVRILSGKGVTWKGRVYAPK